MVILITEGDHNVISGVEKFINQYKLMTKSHAPSSYYNALHNFGKSVYSYYMLAVTEKMLLLKITLESLSLIGSLFYP